MEDDLREVADEVSRWFLAILLLWPSNMQQKDKTLKKKCVVVVVGNEPDVESNSEAEVIS